MITIKPHSKYLHKESGLTFENETNSPAFIGKITINGTILHDTPRATDDGPDRMQALEIDLRQPPESPIQSIKFQAATHSAT